MFDGNLTIRVSVRCAHCLDEAVLDVGHDPEELEESIADALLDLKGRGWEDDDWSGEALCPRCSAAKADRNERELAAARRRGCPAFLG